MKKRLVGDCRLYADKCTSASRLVIVTSLQEITSKCYKRKVIKRSRANIAVSKPRLNQTPSHKITLPPPKKNPKTNSNLFVHMSGWNDDRVAHE